jgi:hypothetical protein
MVHRLQCLRKITYKQLLLLIKLDIPGSSGTGEINSKTAVTLSPGITILTFSGNSTFPVISAVRI